MTAEPSTESTAQAQGEESTEAASTESTETTESAEQTSASDDTDEKVSPLENEAEIAADFLEELLDIADLDGDIDTFIENDRAQVSIVTDSQTLVGKDGEVLEALQELVRLAVMAETDGRTRLMLDVAGFREKRRKQLREIATDVIQEVKDSGESVRLAPMNPFERKIVHDVVTEAGLTSESEGTEPNRRVVVVPAAK
ncbi:MAG TPA: protein jag [Candidatus Avipropionibacterium avicola]|uniref:Protein jag n=1 Tax=Candidatus Avipropionibacterium avicola TaxID=2840701 RepID=A0A9D1GXZ2_9ACTN|nr:protein jag [Candidatus Avipropionibacterium avicola]